MSPSGWRSSWGWRAAAGYALLLSAAAGYLTYHRLFNFTRFRFPGTLLVSLGLPWTRLFWAGPSAEAGSDGWLVLLVSFAVNAGMLYFIGSRMEQLARGSSR